MQLCTASKEPGGWHRGSGHSVCGANQPQAVPKKRAIGTRCCVWASGVRVFGRLWVLLGRIAQVSRSCACVFTAHVCSLPCVQAPRKFTSGVAGKMGYEDFVWFILSEEDKTTDTALEYWFK